MVRKSPKNCKKSGKICHHSNWVLTPPKMSKSAKKCKFLKFCSENPPKFEKKIWENIFLIFFHETKFLIKKYSLKKINSLKCLDCEILYNNTSLYSFAWASNIALSSCTCCYIWESWCDELHVKSFDTILKKNIFK